MEQILTIEQEKQFVANYFKYAFNITDGEIDEFTGERTYAGSFLSNFIKFDDEEKFFDSDFLKIGSQSAQQSYNSTLSLKSEFFQMRAAVSGSQDSYSAIEKAKIAAENETIEEYRKRSSLMAFLNTTFSRNSNKPQFELTIVFTNHSHNRDLKNPRILILDANKSRHELPLDSATIKHTEDDFWFEDSITLNLTPDMAKLLTTKGTKVSVRFDNLIINGIVNNITSKITEENSKDITLRDKSITIDIDKYLEMTYLYNEYLNNSGNSIFTEEQIDDLYDYCIKAEELFNKRLNIAKETIENKKVSLEKEEAEKHANNVLEPMIGKSVNPYEYDTLELLFTDPQQIQSILKLKEYCDKNGIHSRNYNWLFTISDKYDKEAILLDIKRCRNRSKTSKITRFIIMAIACILFGTCCTITYQGPQFGLDVEWAWLFFFASILFWRWGRKKSKVSFSKSTINFLNDFEQRFK